jgi:hypothetical protein
MRDWTPSSDVPRNPRHRTGCIDCRGRPALSGDSLAAPTIGGHGSHQAVGLPAMRVYN